MFLGRGFEFRRGAVREWEERFASLIAEEARRQRLLEGIGLTHAVRRGDIHPPDRGDPSSIHEHSRLEMVTFSWLASGLRTAA